MFSKYDIIKYEKGNITFRFDNDSTKIITVDININFPNYEPCYDYYFNSNNKLIRLQDSNGELKIIRNNQFYTKCYQYQYDHYNTKYPICSNGLLYKYMLEIYKSLFV